METGPLICPGLETWPELRDMAEAIKRTGPYNQQSDRWAESCLSQPESKHFLSDDIDFLFHRGCAREIWNHYTSDWQREQLIVYYTKLRLER